MPLNEQGFSRPTLPEIHGQIRDDINTRLPGAEARLRRATLNVLGAVFAGSVHLLYGFIAFIAKNVMIDTAQTVWLERHGSQWNIFRKAATFANGMATVTGTDGAVLPVGAELQRADGALFSVESDGTIVAGTATVNVSAQAPGIDGNTETATKLTLVSPIVGLMSELTVASPGISGGVETESDEGLRERLLLRIRETPHGGSKTDYEQWALSVSGVTRAWAFPNELGAGTVTVRFVMDGKVGSILPDAGEVATVQAFLDTKRPVTAEATVVAPTQTPLDFTINVSPDTAEIRAAITARLTDLLFRDGEPGGTIFLSRIEEAISLASGEFHHTMTAPSDNVTLTPGAMPSLGSITWF